VTGNLSEPSELAEYARLEGDPIHGLQIRGGEMSLPAGPGLGVFSNIHELRKEAL
jgi:hypothetical protein